MISNAVNPSLTAYDSIFFPLLTEKKKIKNKKCKRILIIDDDQEMSRMLQSILEKDSELKITTAQDPFDAMDMMIDQAFDLIVLEWNLPKLNGLETLLETEKGFKYEPNLPLEWDDKKVPVIILSDCEKAVCKPPYTKHFRYLAYINKSNSLMNIVESLRFQFLRTQ